MKAFSPSSAQVSSAQASSLDEATPKAAPRVEFYRHQLGEDEATSWHAAFESLFLTLGPQVSAFEKELGHYLARPAAPLPLSPQSRPRGGHPADITGDSSMAPPWVVGTNSCSMGLLLALRAFDIGPGDEVITTPMTFASTTNAILHAGARPVLVDVEPSTGLLDPKRVERAITPRTRALMPVHLYGQLADMRALRAIADAHGLVIVEDSAHGIEMERDGVRPGALGDAAVFSFYATKNLTSGDGGAVATRHEAIADRLRRLRNHGVSKAATDRHGQAYQHWDLVELGYKANLTDLDAALLRPQLPKADAKRQRREELAQRYEELLRAAVPSWAAPVPEGQVPFLVERRGRSSHHLFTVQVPSHQRDGVLSHLGAHGIGTAVNYRAIHTLTYLANMFPWPRGSFPVAEEIGDRTLSLPFYPTLREEDQDRVVEVLAKALATVGGGP